MIRVLFTWLSVLTASLRGISAVPPRAMSNDQLLDRVVNYYENKNSKCVNVIWDSGMREEFGIQIFQRDTLSFQIFDLKDVTPGQMREASLFCHYYIILINDKDSVAKFLETNQLEVKLNSGYFLILTGSSQAYTLLYDSVLKHVPKCLIVEMLPESKTGGYPVYLPKISKNLKDYTVDFWTGDKFVVNDEDLYPDVVSNMGGRMLSVVAFHFPPYLLFNKHVNGTEYYTGYEYTLIKVIAEAMNFEIERVALPDDNKFWGAVKFDANGTAIPTGIVGNLYEYKADIGVANIYVSLERYEVIAFSVPYRYDYGIFVTRKPPPIPQWQALTFPFTAKLWISFLFSVVLCTIFILLYALVYRDEFQAISEGFFTLFRIILEQSASKTNSAKTEGLKFFIGIYILTIFIMTLSYKGSLISVLTVPHVPPPVDTVKELLETSPVRMGGIGLSLINHGRNSPNKNVRKLIGEDYVKFDSAKEAFKNCSEGKNDLIFSMLSAEYNILTDYTNEFGETDFHILKEKYKGFMASFGFPMINLYGRKISKKIFQLFEGGIIGRIRRDTIEQGTKISSIETAEDQKALTLNNLQGAFFVWILMFILSLCVFASETCLKSKKTFQ